MVLLKAYTSKMMLLLSIRKPFFCCRRETSCYLLTCLALRVVELEFRGHRLLYVRLLQTAAGICLTEREVMREFGGRRLFHGRLSQLAVDMCLVHRSDVASHEPIDLNANR